MGDLHKEGQKHNKIRKQELFKNKSKNRFKHENGEKIGGGPENLKVDKEKNEW